MLRSGNPIPRSRLARSRFSICSQRLAGLMSGLASPSKARACAAFIVQPRNGGPFVSGASLSMSACRGECEPALHIGQVSFCIGIGGRKGSGSAGIVGQIEIFVSQPMDTSGITRVGILAILRQRLDDAHEHLAGAVTKSNDCLRTEEINYQNADVGTRCQETLIISVRLLARRKNEDLKFLV